MTATPKPDALQQKGTREFDEAIAGKGPTMPESGMTPEEDAALEEALEESFPASDPAKPSTAGGGIGAPKGRESIEPTKR